jgi:hemolysin III
VETHSQSGTGLDRDSGRVRSGYDQGPVRPRWRGISHQYAFYASLAGAMPLLLLASGAAATAAAAVFVAGACLMFGASALYNRVDWQPGTLRDLMRRIDHSGVFVMIAASYTPYALLVLRGAWTIALLAVVWAAVAIAIGLRVARPDAPGWLTAAIAVVLGWVSVVALPEAIEVLSAAALALLLAGGLLYTAGAAVYVLRRPNPAPAVFGFHELFHALVVAAVACHYATTALVLAIAR